MGYKEQVVYLLLGVVLYVLIRQLAKVTKINIPSGTIQFVAYTGGLLFIAANISISSCFFLITQGGNAMTPDGLHTIATYAYAFWALAFVLGGGIIAAILSAFLFAFRNRAKSQSSSPDAIDKTGEQIGNKPKFNIDLKVDTKDLAKMNAKQLKAVNDIIARLQGKKNKIG